ncbi:hypothetical protein [Flavobacterium sp. N1736]|uniref:hypothetical protein n=1 Tax=Flavobacterium sp. N1736 TaxID=2986823 RepID=UPI0022245C74|nr:hypothetical protein [Flavobacterium sp. N1736]
MKDNRSGSVIQKKDGYLVDNRPGSVHQRKISKSPKFSSLDNSKATIQRKIFRYVKPEWEPVMNEYQDVIGKYSPPDEGDFEQNTLFNTANGFYGENLEAIVDHQFVKDAINNVKSSIEKLNEDQCGDAARSIYKAIGETGPDEETEFEGKGVDNLAGNMNKAKSHNGVEIAVIFYVDTEIMGHFFTILQKGNFATIMQGYVNKMTIEQNMEGHRHIWTVDALISSLKELMTIRDRWAKAEQPDEEIILIKKIWKKLFSIDLTDKDMHMLRINIFAKREDDLNWKGKLTKENSNPEAIAESSSIAASSVAASSHSSSGSESKTNAVKHSRV